MTSLFDDLIVLEMANNHQGSLEHGVKIVRCFAALARQHRIKAGFKFQYRDLEDLVHPSFFNRDDIPHVSRFRQTRLPPSSYELLNAVVRDEGLITICTPFDEPSVGRLQDHGVQVIRSRVAVQPIGRF